MEHIQAVMQNFLFGEGSSWIWGCKIFLQGGALAGGYREHHPRTPRAPAKFDIFTKNFKEKLNFRWKNLENHHIFYIALRTVSSFYQNQIENGKLGRNFGVTEGGLRNLFKIFKNHRWKLLSITCYGVPKNFYGKSNERQQNEKSFQDF